MSLYHKIIPGLFILTLFSLIIFSYALVDPNFTLINNSAWTLFRNAMVQFGYYQGTTSSIVYLFIIAILYFCHFYLVKNAQRISIRYILCALGITTFLSYPFLSHDLFNYMFDARIFTHYGQNPYIHKALDFPQDDWIRFMHWTHRTYPYGPTFLALTIIPSFFSFGKLLLSFLFFKGFFYLFFVAAVLSLYRMNKKWGVFFATNPLVIIEGLVNAHNDLLAVSLTIIGIYLLREKKTAWARIILILSGGIKYITAPFILIGKKDSIVMRAVFIATCGLLAYLAAFTEVQGWYFLVLFGFLPYYENILDKANIFFAGLLIAYYPFVQAAGWGVDQIQDKHTIIIVFYILFLLSLGSRKKIVL